VYRLLGNKQAEIYALRKLNYFQGKLVDEKLTTQLEDYQLLEKYEEINTENKLLEVTNLSSKEQISKQRQIQLFLIIAVIAPISLTAFALAPATPAVATCEAKAAEKKLAGAAKNSFVMKCEKDAAGG
jgi:hypothetical protein